MQRSWEMDSRAGWEHGYAEGCLFRENEAEYEPVKPVGFDAHLAFERERVQTTQRFSPAPVFTEKVWQSSNPGTSPYMPCSEIWDDTLETHQDPLMERSHALMEHTGPFWAPAEEKTKEIPVQGKALREKRRHTWRGALLALAAGLCVGAIALNVLFTLRAVKVSGNVNVTQEEILEIAGISLGQNMLSLDEESIARRVNANRYLSFESLRMDWPDGVTLFVTERLPSAYTSAYGMLYIIAADGTVLEESNDIDNPPQLPLAQGLQEGSATLGQKVRLAQSQKMSAFTSLIDELRVQDYLEQIAVINLAETDNIYLETTDGYTVRLGDDDDLRAKIGALRAVRLKLLELEKEGGTISVADDPVHPTYMP